MTEFQIVAKASTIFIRPIEEFKDGVMKGEVWSVGRNGQSQFCFDDIVIYLIDDTLVEFTEPNSGHKMHAVLYYKILGKFQKINHRKKAVDFEKPEDISLRFKGDDFV